MTSILITGNMGYVGSCLVSHLRRLYPDARLIGLDTGFFAASLWPGQPLPECLLDLQHFHDIRQPLGSLLSGVDAIVHLAAISNDPMGTRYQEATHAINHQAAIRLAREARQAGVTRFVFASSCSVYGLAEESARTEQSSVNPLTAYARSKVACERDLQELASGDFVVTCLRFATACGPSPRLRLDLVLNDFVASAVSARQIQILSNGRPWRPLITVEDMARALDWALTRAASAGGEFLIVNAGANDWNYQIHELASAVAELVPGTAVEMNKNAAPDNRSYRVDFSLFRLLAPHHQPAASLRQVIANLRNLLESSGFHDANFRSSSFMRLHVLAKFVSDGELTNDLEWGFRKRYFTEERGTP
jgi:nucleoside-diphosphate-sugar epimerase